MIPKATQEELQAATYATLRAHATSEQANALVAKLASMVEEHSIATGLRKNKRKRTAGKLEYATGAFLADLLPPRRRGTQWVGVQVLASQNIQAREGAPGARLHS